MIPSEDYSAHILGEIFNTLIGAKLGRGIGRTTYVLKSDPKLVIKIEDTGESFQNIIEWETWKDAEYTKQAKWFAPCHFISPGGAVLVQSRTQPLGKYPIRMPNFLTDFKRDNYGVFNGRVVCHDYGTNALARNGLKNARLKKVHWWE